MLSQHSASVISISSQEAKVFTPFHIHVYGFNNISLIVTIGQNGLQT